MRIIIAPILLTLAVSASAAAQDVPEPDIGLEADPPPLDVDVVEEAPDAIEEEDAEEEEAELTNEADPFAAPASTSVDEPAAVSTTEPAVSTPTETSEPAASASDAEEEEEDLLPFRGSTFSWNHGVTAHTFNTGAQLTHNPTYEMTFSLTPRWYLLDSTYLWLNQSLYIELTDSDSTTYNREPLLTDTALEIRHVLEWEGFAFTGAGRLAFPLSKGSQAANRILQTGLGVSVVRPFPDALDFTIATGFSYRRWWATTNVAQTDEAYPGNCFVPSPGEAPLCTQASGATSGRDTLSFDLSLSISPFERFTVALSGALIAIHGHELAPVALDISGGTVVLEDESSHWRNYTYFALAASYDLVDWLSLTLGIANAGSAAALYNPDGSVRSPFSTDTQIFLTGTLGIDGVYSAIAGD